jgi:predicted RNA-binding Zn-ribbon protein involved in translation (DUF1610 family)
MIDNPSDKEQEYFLRKELERIKALREEHKQKQAEEERVRMKELHFMHCTKCGQRMATTSFGGVDIEVCPDCGGIYLDAGELDKIVDDKKRGPFAMALGSFRRLWKD